MKPSAPTAHRLIQQLCALVLFFSLTVPAFSQNSTNYAVVNSTTGSLATDMNGNPISFTSSPNLIINSSTNAISTLQPIGFDFYFMGKYFSHFVATDDGALALGIASSPTSIISTGIANDLTRTVTFPYTANTSPVLAAFWDNTRMPDNGPTVRKTVTGLAPNRCAVIEFNVVINTTSNVTTSTGQYQIRLYESTGVIEYVYGNMALGAGSTLVTASIGFTAGSTDNSFLALRDLSSFAFTALAAQEPASQNLVASPTPGPIAALNSSVDGSRRLFRFTPPALTGGPLAPLVVGGVGGSTLTVSWIDNFSNEAGYSVFRSTDNVNFDLVAALPPNTTSYTAYNLAYNTTYYWKVVAASEGVAGNTASGSGTTVCGMSGSYTVGTGGHFSSLANAMDSLRIRGIAGNTVFELLPTYTITNETLPIRFPKNAALPCFSQNRRLTVRPAAGANLTLFKYEANPIFLLDSCDYVTIDGRVNSQGTTSSLLLYAMINTPAIQLTNASHNQILYVKIDGSDYITGTTTPGVINLNGTTASGCDQNVIEGCTFSSTGTEPKQCYIYQTTNGAISNDRDTIRNCNFYDFSKNAIFLGNGSNGWQISGNSFYAPTNRSYNNCAAVQLDFSFNTDENVIERNYFGGTAPNASGGPMVIDYSSKFVFIEVVGKAKITQNVFRRIKFSNANQVNGATLQCISTSLPGRPFQGLISENEFGGQAAADSINITHNTFSSAYFSGIAGGGTIVNNRFQNIRAYSGPGNVALSMISINKGGEIRNNMIGSTVANSISNYTDAAIVGIEVAANTTAITNNQISHLTGMGTGSWGIVLGIQVGNNTVDSIANNEIFQLQCSTSLGAVVSLCGITTSATTQTTPVVAFQNHIYNLHYRGNSAVRVVGIYSETLKVTANLIHSFSTAGGLTSNFGVVGGVMVDNNMIQLGLDSLGNSVTAPIAITGITAGNLVVHNSIVITGSNVASGINRPNCVSPTGGSYPDRYRNNIFYMDRSAAVAGTLKSFCVDFSTATPQTQYCDYNVFYHPGPDNYIAPLNSTGFTSLTAWQTAATNDQHSVDGNPMFVRPFGNASNLDLHLSFGSIADAIGISQNTTTYDFDGQVRSQLTPVDIGADAGNFHSCAAIKANNDTTICAGSTIHLANAALAGLTYAWTSNTSFTSSQPDPVVTPTTTTRYYLEVTGACNIKDTIQVIVKPWVTPSVSITANPTTFCSYSQVSFTAVASNGGSAPAFAWQLNGSTVGANSSVLTASNLNNNDKVSVILTNSDICVTNNAAKDTFTANVLPSVPVQLTLTGSTVLNLGDTVTLTVSMTVGNVSGSYQWQDSTQNHGWQNITATGNTLRYVAKNTGDKVRVLFVTGSCTTPVNPMSNLLVFTVNPVTAVTTITADGMLVYPNPASSVLVLDHLSLNDQWRTASVIPMSGQVILQTSNLRGQTKIMISLANLSSGNYLLMIKSATGKLRYYKFAKL